jgi:DNA replication initiation complex subunit (GINS family)
MPIEAFTYEDIYELLRAEKFSTDLENIKSTDLARIQAYLKAKEDLLSKQDSSVSILSSQKKIKIQQEINNALRALKDLYEIRERKIINRAIYNARTGSEFKDTTNMLENEIDLYERLLAILKDQKDIFFKTLEKASEIEEKNLEISKTKPVEAGQPVYEDPEENETPAHIEEQKCDPIKFVGVKFIEECPEVFGEDLEKYGPFESGTEAKLPEQLFSILEKQKKVERKEST